MPVDWPFNPARPRPEQAEMHRNAAEDTRRRQLITATIDTIAEVGFGAATLAQIGQRAGVSPGLIAHYFADKDGLLEATLRSLAGRLSLATTSRLRAARTPRERIQAVIEATLAPEEFDPRSCGVWLAFWGQVIHSEPLRRVQTVYQQRMLSNLRHALRRLVPDPEAPRLAVALAAMIDGLWLRASLSARNETDSATARAIATAFIDDAIARAATPDPEADAAVAAAVAAAAVAQPGWAARPARDRAAVLRAAAAELCRASLLAEAEGLDAVASAIFGDEPGFGGAGRVPHGVLAAVVAPSSFAEAMAMAGPALAAGNALVLGTEGAPTPALAGLSGRFAAAGLPAGVLCIVPVSGGAAGHLLGHAGVTALPPGAEAGPTLVLLADGAVDDAVAASIHLGGRLLAEEVLRPALAARLPDAEIRGFADDREAVALLDADGGDEVGLFTRDMVRAHRLLAGLRAGRCWVNVRPSCLVDWDRYARRRVVSIGVPESR
jgi:transcriptional repressor BetI